MKRAIIQTLLQAGRRDLANVVAYHQVTAAKQLYYHGTSTVFAKRILSEGFVPNPKRKVWDQEGGRLASYQGTYFSTNFMTASSSAMNAAKKFQGRKCIFEVQLETRTALMDEDQLPDVKYQLNNTAGYLLFDMLYNKATGYSAEYGKEENREWVASSDAKKLVGKAAGDWIENFVAQKIRGEVKPLPRKYTDGLRKPIEQWMWALLRAAAEGYHENVDAEPPDVQKAKTEVMRKIGSIARFSDGSFIGNNARVLTPVDFRGANKILAAVVEPQRHDPIEEGRDYKDPKPVYVVYGKPSGNLVAQMKQAWSPNLDLIRMPLSRVPNVFDPFSKREKMAARYGAAE